MTWTATTDSNGVYQLWLDEAHSPLTITIEAPEYQKGVTTDVTVIGGSVNTVNFDLRWLGACVKAAPPALHFTLMLGMTASEAITLTNTGAADANWILAEEDLGGPIGAPPPRVEVLLADDFEGTIPPALPLGWQTTAVDRPSGPQPAWYSNVGTHYPSGNSAHSGANLVYFNSNDLSGALGLNTARLWYMQALSGMNTLTYWMYHDTYSSASDDRVQVQASTDGGVTWVNAGLAVSRYDSTSGWRQETVNLSAYTEPPAVLIGFLGMSDDGYDIHIDDVVAAYVDPVTWLAEAPVFGVLTADFGVQTVAVDFDATVLDQPGDYVANLQVAGNDLGSFSVLPVTLTATPSTFQGLLKGTVSSLGRCDIATATLEGAAVGIWNAAGSAVVTLTTNTAGAYRYWLPAGAYTVTVAAPDHVDESAGVTVAVGSVVTRDFGLTSLEPCVASVEPLALEVSVMMGLARPCR